MEIIMSEAVAAAVVIAGFLVGASASGIYDGLTVKKGAK